MAPASASICHTTSAISIFNFNLVGSPQILEPKLFAPENGRSLPGDNPGKALWIIWSFGAEQGAFHFGYIFVLRWMLINPLFFCIFVMKNFEWMIPQKEPERAVFPFARAKVIVVVLEMSLVVVMMTIRLRLQQRKRWGWKF